jgi:hypothetical protein
MKTPNLKSPVMGLALAALAATAPVWADPATVSDSNAKSEDIGIVTGLAVDRRRDRRRRRGPARRSLS